MKISTSSISALTSVSALLLACGSSAPHEPGEEPKVRVTAGQSKVLDEDPCDTETCDVEACCAQILRTFGCTDGTPQCTEDDNCAHGWCHYEY